MEKIRGNLRWFRHLEEMEGSHSPPPVLRELPALRRDVEELQEAMGAAQRNAVLLEAELGAGLRRRGAGLNRALRLRLLAEAANREGKRLRAALPVPPPLPGPVEVEPELEAAVAMGTEPEVLVATRALCRMREEALKALVEPRPLPETRRLMDASNKRWLRAAQDLLSHHPPAAVLWALRHMTTESIRALQAPPSKENIDPNGDPEAPPTVEALIKECWSAVGGLWARAPPMAARLPPLRQRLQRLQEELGGVLGGGGAARLALLAAGLGGARGALLGGVRSLKGPHTPKNAAPPPQRQWEELWGRAVRGRVAVAKRRRRLRFLISRNAALRAQLQPRQQRIREAAAALTPLPLALEEGGQRLGGALGALGALGAPPAPTPISGAPPALPPQHPLMGVCESLGLPLYQAPREALRRTLELREELRWLRAMGGACVDPAPSVAPPTERDEEERGVAEMLPRLRVVANQCRRRIEAWPRLQALVSQWWEQPAQWALATPPGSVPFSHWLERWTRATRSHAPSGLQTKPRP